MNDDNNNKQPEYIIDLAKFPDGIDCSLCGGHIFASIPIEYICTHDDCPIYILQDLK